MQVATLASETVLVEVLPEVGARLHRLRVFGHDLVRTPVDPSRHVSDPFFWGSYVMAPWCNRVEAGTGVTIGARRVELASNFPDGSAIHGQVLRRPWRMEAADTYLVKGGGEGWPWEYEVRQRIATGQGSLRLELALLNLSDEPMPAGLGIHPWFRRPLRIAIHARRVHPTNTATEPRPVPVSGRLDLRRMTDVPAGLDGAWTDLADPPVKLAWPEPGISATMRTAPAVGYIVAASPAGLDAVGVEPQTHAPQGLRRLINGEQGALQLLEPGQALRLDVEWEFARTSSQIRSAS